MVWRDERLNHHWGGSQLYGHENRPYFLFYSCQAEQRWAMQLEKTTASEVMHDRFFDHGNQQGYLLESDS